MTALELYIKTKNSYSAIFNGAVISYPPSGDEVAYLFDALECDLSPENLTCDGEIRGATLNRKAKHLNASLTELHKYGSPPDYGY